MNSSRSPSSTWSSRCSGELDAVVGDAALREVVGADLLRPLAGADLRAPRRRELGLLPLALEPRTAVRAARASPSARFWSCDFSSCIATTMPGREVRDAHRRVGRVHALPAGPGRAHDVDLEVLLLDLDLDLLDLGHDGDRRGGGVDPALRLGLGHALHAVRPALELEDRERTLALHREHDLLDAAGLALARRERLGLEPDGARRSG